MSFEEWNKVCRKLEEDLVIEFVHSTDCQICKVVRTWLPATWNIKEETDDMLDSQVFLIIGAYELEPRDEERFQRRFVESWLYDRFSQRLSCRRQEGLSLAQTPEGMPSALRRTFAATFECT